MSKISSTFQKMNPKNSPDRFKLIYLLLAFLCLVVVLTVSIAVISGLSYKNLTGGIEINSEKITDALIYTEVDAITIREEQGVVELNVEDSYFDALDNRIRDIFDQLQILKVSIYNKSGLIVYSTDKHTIGTIENRNADLKTALNGTRKLVMREVHNTIDMMGENRFNVDVAEVYVPVFHTDNSVIGTVAVFSDVTAQHKVFRKQLWLSVAILSGSILLLSFVSYLVIERASLELKKTYNLLEVYAKTDALTGACNRGELMRRAEGFFDLMKRSREKLAPGVGIGLIMIDLDYFKKINDTHGHHVGDIVLQHATERIASVLRSYDILGRFGGEEFLILLPNTISEEVHAIAERALESIRSAPIQAGEVSATITASFGATWADAAREDLDNAVRRADDLLYEAKNSGRNRVVFRVGV